MKKILVVGYGVDLTLAKAVAEKYDLEIVEKPMLECPQPTLLKQEITPLLEPQLSFPKETSFYGGLVGKRNKKKRKHR